MHCSLQSYKATKHKLPLGLRQGSGHIRRPCLMCPPPPSLASALPPFLGLAKFSCRFVTSRLTNAKCLLYYEKGFVYSLAPHKEAFLFDRPYFLHNFFRQLNIRKSLRSIIKSRWYTYIA
ncbi:hypothetical protein SAMN02745195_00041 [Thermoanaerobacter uzonensis DSM 18761]|uniref:Uncharacterized protein n=1 Tax=Thermoanaerobacter uzonensis DSM 18761 TaxID=1123369 RepID=A0A1M4S8H7_9THEO|nr:hypothetical protein SAMN02745195_00041 [Thermoanaerobacter uzonensis DSM 18761]